MSKPITITLTEAEAKALLKLDGTSNNFREAVQTQMARSRGFAKIREALA